MTITARELAAQDLEKAAGTRSPRAAAEASLAARALAATAPTPPEGSEAPPAGLAPPSPAPPAAPLEGDGERTNVVSPSGELVSVPSANLDAAQAAGYTLEDPEKADARQYVAAKDRAGTGASASFYRAFENEALLGVPGAVDAYTDSRTTALRKEALDEAHPFAHYGGAALGLGLSTLASAGLGKVAGSLAARVFGRGSAAAAAAGAEGAAAAAQASTKPASFAARALSRAGTDALIGGVYGAPRAAVALAYDDPEKAAETLLYSAGAGAALGVAGESVSSALGGVARGIRGARDAAESHVERLKTMLTSKTAGPGAGAMKQALEAGEAEGDAALSGALEGHAAPGEAPLPGTPAAAPTLTEAVKGLPEEAAEKIIQERFGSDPLAQEAARRVLKNGMGKVGTQEAALDKLTRDITKAGTDALQAERTIGEAAYGEAKARQMSELVPASNHGPATKQALDLWQEAKELQEGLVNDPTRGGDGQLVRKVGTYLEKFASEVGEAGSKKTPDSAARVFMALDDFKRAVGKGARFGEGPFGLSPAAREYEALYEKMRVALEDENVWGKAALAQRDVNLATTRALATSKTFRGGFVAPYDQAAGRPLFEFDPASVKGFLRNVNGAENDLKARSAADWATGMRARMNAVEKHYALSLEQKASFASARRSLDAFETTLKGARHEASVVEKVRTMRLEEEGRAHGGLLGLVTDARTRPLRTIERLAHIRDAGGRAAEVLGSSPLAEKLAPEALGAAWKSTLDALEAGPRRLEEVSRGPGAALAERGLSASLGRVFGPGIETKHGTLTREGYERVRDTLASVESDPGHPVTESHGDVAALASHVSPAVGTAYQAKARAAWAYLARALPQDPSVPSPFERESKWMPSDDELESFSDKARVVGDPFSVFESVAHGTLSHDEIDALQTVYPKLYGALQESLLGYASAHPERFQALPEAQKAKLEELLGMSVERDSDVASYQALFAPTPSGHPEPSPSPSPSKPATPSRARSFTVSDSRTTPQRLLSR